MRVLLAIGIPVVGLICRTFRLDHLSCSLQFRKEGNVRFAWQPEHAIPPQNSSSSTWVTEYRSVPSA